MRFVAQFLGELTVSVEALAYVKSLDLGECEKARLLMYVVGENTFNDTFVCKVGIEQLAFEARVNEKTVRRQLAALEARRFDDGSKRRAYVLRRRRHGHDGGRRHDEIRIVGFKRWYLENYGAAKRSHRAKSGDENPENLTDKMSGRRRPLAGKMSGSNRTPVSGSNRTLVSGTYKDSRTSPVLSEDARLSAQEDSISDLKVKAVRQRLRRELGLKVFEAWFSQVAFVHNGTTVSAETSVKAVRNWIRDRYEATILRVCQAEWPEVTRIEFNLKNQGAAR